MRERRHEREKTGERERERVTLMHVKQGYITTKPALKPKELLLVYSGLHSP